MQILTMAIIAPIVDAPSQSDLWNTSMLHKNSIEEMKKVTNDHTLQRRGNPVDCPTGPASAEDSRDGKRLVPRVLFVYSCLIRGRNSLMPG